MKRYKIKFLIQNPEEDCGINWILMSEQIMGKLEKTEELCEPIEYMGDSIEIWHQEYAEHRGWTR